MLEGLELLVRALASAFRVDESSVRRRLPDLLNSLLALEKERRGFGGDELVFVGMANVAEYRWCAMKSVHCCRVNELGFFAAYLEDRLSYWFELEGVEPSPENLPSAPEELLELGDSITLDYVERLLRKRSTPPPALPPDLPPDLGARLQEALASSSSLPRDLVEEVVEYASRLPPMERGELLEELLAERYPTIRWNFRWSDYVVVGVPDGLTDRFVYEFKTSRDGFLASYARPVLVAQADLYGFFFRRGVKRVQLLKVRERELETLEAGVDEANARETLLSFQKAEREGKLRPPKKWKCKSCEYRTICPIVR